MRSLPATVGLVVLPMLAIASLHYLTPSEHHWVHDLARRLFYVPILLAGTRHGVRGGLAAAVGAIVLYVPHAFSGHMGHDPGSHTEKLFEMVFYVVIGVASGLVMERERRRQDELRRKDALLDRAARLESLGQLSAGLAHEIRNPLHAMRGTAEILLDAVLEEGPERRMGQAHIQEIDRLSGVLQRFLEFARDSDVDLSQRVELDGVVRRVAELVRAQAGRDDILVETRTSGGVVRGDGELLTQVLLALAVNGIQAAPAGGRLCLAAEGLTLWVENSGSPVASDVLERVFDPFFTTRDDGTGLGLSIAWKIVDQHGGEIRAENTTQGVRFVVELPPG